MIKPDPNEILEEVRAFYLTERECPSARFRLLLSLFGPGPRPKCPDDGKKKDSLGNVCEGPWFSPGCFADGIWYCPVHGGVGKKITSAVILKRMKAVKAVGTNYGAYDDDDD